MSNGGSVGQCLQTHNIDEKPDPGSNPRQLDADLQHWSYNKMAQTIYYNTFFAGPLSI